MVNFSKIYRSLVVNVPSRLVIASFSDYSLEKSIFALKYYSLSLVASSIKIYSLSLDILSDSVFASRYYSLLHLPLKLHFLGGGKAEKPENATKPVIFLEN